MTLNSLHISGSSSQVETTTPLTHLSVTTTTMKTEFQCKYYALLLGKLEAYSVLHTMY